MASEKEKAQPSLVKAKREGFYNGNLIAVDKRFRLKKPQDFSPRWMEPVSDGIDEIDVARVRAKANRDAAKRGAGQVAPASTQAVLEASEAELGESGIAQRKPTGSASVLE